RLRPRLLLMPVDAPFILTPPAAGLEGLVLNGLNLNAGPSGGTYSLEVLDMTPPQKMPEWAKGADNDGQSLVRLPLFDNRKVTATIRIENQATMDAALAAVGVLVDQIQEAEKNPGGIPLVWTPATGTRSFTLYVLTGQVTGIPISMAQAAGWFVSRPVVTLELTCKPLGYGPEVVGAGVTSTSPVVTLTIANVPGDVPAEGRLIVTEGSSAARRFLEWGLEQRYYNAVTALLIDSEDLVTAGFSGVQATHGGCYRRPGAVNDVVGGPIYSTPTAICGTGPLSHVGSFRVKARVIVGGAPPVAQVRFVYQDGDGPFRANPWVTPPIGNTLLSEIDLGLISITATQAGTQKWSGRIEGQSALAGDYLNVDYIVLVPAGEGYGKARAPYTTGAGSIVGFDALTGVTAGTVLNGLAGTAGGTWATSGAATDWAYSSTYSPTALLRATAADASPRFGVLGAARTDTAVQATVTVATAAYGGRVGVVARWVDASNYAVAFMAGGALTFQTVVGGAAQTNLTYTWPNAGAVTQLGLSIQPSGAWSAGGISNGSTFSISGVDNNLLTGGALASGKAGLYDYNSGAAIARSFAAFSITGLPAESIVMYPSRTLEVRSDSTIRQDATGTYYGPTPQYRGTRFFVPQAGSAGRVSRVLVKAGRNDVESIGNADGPVGDSLTAAVAYTPRYHVIPR
ncbi:MAG: hypothetical protein M3O28_07850, partial [Actinomycetota bacterium]|nr:hypothetical protein [Actinomycetota bacterium]